MSGMRVRLGMTEGDRLKIGDGFYNAKGREREGFRFLNGGL